jgi:hypothetical protein
VNIEFYSRRKVIIDEIKRLMAGGREAMDVVDSLEDQRKKSNASLSQVINGLKADDGNNSGYICMTISTVHHHIALNFLVSI